MIRDIVHDVIFLGRKSEAATKEDLPVVQDLLDTLKANRRTCVGMAANMIGSLKRIIVVHTDRGDEILINPVIEKKTDPFPAEEGCLSLVGTRKTTRYRKIQVFYQDRRFRKHRQTFTSSMNVTTWTVSSYESIDDCEFDEAFDAGADCGLVFCDSLGHSLVLQYVMAADGEP